MTISHSSGKSSKRIATLVAALRLARPVIHDELQSLCTSYCTPCRVCELCDHSGLCEPELGWITRTEAALDAVDAALKGEGCDPKK